MEHTVTRLRFRLSGRGTTLETDGRIVHSPDGTHVMQVGYSTPEHAHILLEAGPVKTEGALWGLFQKLCDYRSLQPTEYRVFGPRGPGDWLAFPAADASVDATATATAKAAASKKRK